MRARADARGSIELRGPTWWLRRRVEVIDRETGETRLVRRRERLGPVTELRTHKQARAAADEWIQATRLDELVPGRTMLAIAYLEQFKRTHVKLMRPTSQAVYRGIINKHLIPDVAGLRLRELDTTWLKRMLAAKVRAGLAHATVQNIRGVALHVLRRALTDGYGAIRIDPRQVRLPRQVSVVRDRRYIDADEFDRILAASNFPWRALWALMGYAGLRVGEALGLEWEQVDFEQRFLTVRQQAVRGNLSAPKTVTSQADVPILPQLGEVLALYQAHCMAAEPNLKPPTGLLFRTRNRTPYWADDIRRRVLQPFLRSLGLAHAGHHAFRHGVPRMLAQRGISGAVIQQVMRHGTLAQTEEYLHVHARDIWQQLIAKGIDRALQSSAAGPHTAPSPARAAEVST